MHAGVIVVQLKELKTKICLLKISYIYIGCTQYETLILRLAINDSVFKDGKKVTLNVRIGESA